LCGGAPPWLERVPVCGLFCEGWWRPGSFACVRHRCASVAWCRGPKQAAGWQPPRAVANGWSGCFLPLQSSVGCPARTVPPLSACTRAHPLTNSRCDRMLHTMPAPRGGEGRAHRAPIKPIGPHAPLAQHHHHANASEQRNPMGRKGTTGGSGAQVCTTAHLTVTEPNHAAARHAQHLPVPCRRARHTARPLPPANAAERRWQRRHAPGIEQNWRPLPPAASDGVNPGRTRPLTHHRLRPPRGRLAPPGHRSPSGTKRQGSGQRGSGCRPRTHPGY
jgi:hypothetical protein